MSSRLFSIAALSALLAAPALADGDAANGEKVFRKCAACHTIDEGAPNRVGPNLHGVVGRVTGSLEGFKFSDAMIAAGEEGHVWTVEELDKYLENPRGMITGNKMAFAGLKKPEERADVIAYLVSQSGDAAE